MTISNTSSTPATARIFALREHRVARIEGPDAAKFLQGQCTNDVDALGIGESQLSAHCNHKGRVISSFILSRESDSSFLLRFRENLADTAMAALQKYLVFSKATLSLTDLDVFVIIKNEPGDFPDFKLHSAIASYHLQEKHLELYIPAGSDIDLAQIVGVDAILSPDQWNTELLRQGVYEVEQSTSEHFLPQELNYDCLGAVNFKKGCYTGQEVIARLHYRGEAKKRLRLGRVELTDVAIPTQVDVIDTESNKSCGSVLLAVSAAEYGRDFLALVKNSALASECVLDLNSPAKIEWLELPYAIP